MKILPLVDAAKDLLFEVMQGLLCGDGGLFRLAYGEHVWTVQLPFAHDMDDVL